MMKKEIIRLITVISGLLLAIILPAQELPLITPDPAVKHGVLPNGMKYYLVSNPSVKGFADFALVQKTGTGTVADSGSVLSVSVAKEALAELPRIKGVSPQAWLASHGVTTTAEGFINVSDDATVFRFHDVPLSAGKDVADSTLLLLMSIVDRVSVTDNQFVKDWYAPADQAIVVSGDINVDAVATKIGAMSYMTPAQPSQPRKEYEWVGTDTAKFQSMTDPEADLTSVTLAWRLPRAPREYMPTVQPAIYEKFVNELGYIAHRRIVLDLERRGVPIADVKWRHRSSADGPGDEIFISTAFVEDEHALDAVAAMARAFAALDASSTTLDEYCLARDAYMRQLHTLSKNSYKSNTEYLNRCISAFLRNSALASPTEKYKFHASKDLSDRTQLELFNHMADALIDCNSNLTVRCISAGPSYNDKDMRTAFYAAWGDSYYNPSPMDAFYEKPEFQWPGYGPKIKLKETKTDPMSGGTVLTYSNGFRVIHKKMNTEGKVYWAMAMNGGYGSIPDLAEGEGAYVGDYFSLCRIGGVEASYFEDMLMSEGITMDARVGLTATLLSGEAPKANMEKLLQALLAVSNEREHDEDVFDLYMANEKLRLRLGSEGRNARLAAIDSIMCPGYKYSRMKSQGKLTSGFAAKADAFYEVQAGKMNDGALILVSDMDETELRKLLLNYVGAFRTQESAFRRPSMRYQPKSGWSTHTVEGERESIDVVMSVAMPLTMDNYVTASIASKILEQSLADDLSETGMYPKVSYNFQISPKERLSIMVSVESVSPMGYASHIGHTGSMEALAIVREGLQDLTHTKISDTFLAACKEHLKNLISFRMQEPMYWVDAIAKRYLDGKDFTTGFAARVDAVTEDKVKLLLLALNEGSKVEYVVK